MRDVGEVLVRADVSLEIFKSVLCWAIKEVTDAVIKRDQSGWGAVSILFQMMEQETGESCYCLLASLYTYRLSIASSLSFASLASLSLSLSLSLHITDDTRSKLESTLYLFLPYIRHLSLPIDWLVLESIKALICQSKESDDQTLRLSWWFQLIFKIGLGNFALYDWTMRPLTQKKIHY